MNNGKEIRDFIRNLTDHMENLRGSNDAELILSYAISTIVSFAFRGSEDFGKTEKFLMFSLTGSINYEILFEDRKDYEYPN